MNGLPGRLTFWHIEKAEERGDNYIFYKRVNYPLSKLKEMYNGPRIGRTKQKPKARADIHGGGVDNRNGEVAEFGSDERKE